jgi:hypothetical protein
VSDARTCLSREFTTWRVFRRAFVAVPGTDSGQACDPHEDG